MGYVLAGIFILATLCLPWIVYFRFGTLRDEVEDIRRDLKILQDKLSFLDRRAQTLIGFGCMTVVTALAVVLSLRHGQAIAVFG